MKSAIGPARPVLLVAALTIACLPAQGAEESKWQWRLTPLYYWSVNITGNQASGTADPPIDTGQFDFNFEGAFSADFEGVYDNRWGFVTDIIWINLANTNDANGRTFDYEYLQAEIDGYYRVPIGRQTIDWLAGLRYYENEFELRPTTIAGKKNWVDPVVGARWMWRFAEGWSVTLRGDVGGFGVGSDLSWQAFALADWQPWKHVSFTGGFRAIGVDYSDGSGPELFRYDLTIWGPILGLSFKW